MYIQSFISIVLYKNIYCFRKAIVNVISYETHFSYSALQETLVLIFSSVQCSLILITGVDVPKFINYKTNTKTVIVQLRLTQC